jgi:hypothetical protein
VIVDGANGRRIYTRSDVESANVSRHCVVWAVEQTRGKSNIPIDLGPLTHTCLHSRIICGVPSIRLWKRLSCDTTFGGLSFHFAEFKAGPIAMQISFEGLVTIDNEHSMDPLARARLNLKFQALSRIVH